MKNLSVILKKTATLSVATSTSKEAKPSSTFLTVVRKESDTNSNPYIFAFRVSSLANNPDNWDVEWFNNYE